MGSSPLQFDHAEPESSSPRCASCQRELSGEYFRVNEHAFCSDCRWKLQPIEAAEGGGLLKAALLGFGAGLVGTAVYYGVLALTGYEIGLISIAVGWLVGRAVFIGSGNRGGRRYQVLAVAVTYFAICASYIPMILGELSQMAEEPAAAEQTASASESPVAPAVDEAGPGEPDGMAGGGDVVQGEIQAAEEIVADDASANAIELSGPVGAVVAILFVVGIAMAAPFLSGIGNILGLLIIGFGLWQAWQGAKPVELAIEGPFPVESKPVEPATEEGSA